jgi:hypothetical protein
VKYRLAILLTCLVTIATTSFAQSFAAGFGATGPTSEISNIQFENVTQTSVDVVWTTVHPSTSQVMLARDTNYEPERQIPAVPDPTLVTTHRVTVGQLVPYNSANAYDGTYYIYVASTTAAGQLSTSPGPGKMQLMHTLPTDTAGSPNTLVYTYGPATAYTGHDTYFHIQPILVSGKVGHLYIQNTGSYNNDKDGVVSPAAGIGVHYSCVWANPTGADSAEQQLSSSMNMGFCYNGNNSHDHSVRLRVPASTATGNYSVTLTLISNGQKIVVNYPFKVVKTPSSISAIPKTTTPIPGLAAWETQMSTLGKKWCAFRDAQDAQGNFEVWGWTADAWFYDGGRVFQQIDDYQANVLQKPDHAYWQHCAQAVLYPYAYYLLANKGNMQGYSIFPYGMTMNYWRTHNVAMMDAVSTLATVGPQYRDVGSIDPVGMRENAYRANMWLANSQLGAPEWPLLQRNIDKLIGMLIMAAEGTGGIGAAAHPFMVGLATETLSRWYAYSVATGKPDYRVVPVMKAALDALWATNWRTSGWFTYNRFEIPLSTAPDFSALNNLNAQGYAWLWYMTGDTTERQHAYDLFSNAFVYPNAFGWSGKQFSQEYEFSFDTVRLLQNNGMSYTDAASNPFSGYWPVTTPPIIVGTNCNTVCATGTIATDHATITWTTYVLASTQVAYGTTTSYGKQTALSDTAGTLSHSATLTGLLSHTTYHFRARSVDIQGNQVQTPDITFTTP